MRILVVEDDDAIADAVVRGLKRSGYETEWVSSGEEALSSLESQEFSLVVLDLMLPDTDGIFLCERLRRMRCSTPVLMVTARDAVHERIRGLEAGADDYLIKPFDFNELLARVRALLRRDKLHRGSTITLSDLQIDTVSRRVTRAGEVIQLTPREYTLLETLARAEGRTFTREMLQDIVWANEDVYPNTVDACIAHLRRKIDNGNAVRLIKTVHGVGYCLEAGFGSEATSHG